MTYPADAVTSRRQFLMRHTGGLGIAALGSLLAKSGLAHDSDTGTSSNSGALQTTHIEPKVKRVIYLMQSGAPSQVDLFDHKPLLAEQRGKEIPESIHQNQKLSTMTAGKKKICLGSIAPFRKRGDCGMEISDYLPYTSQIADDICLIRSMYCEQVNHAPAMTFLLTGGEQPGRPAIGAWLAYGLGSDNENLPTYCVMTSRDQEGSCGQLFYDFYWGNGFLPSRYQGVKFRSGGDPVLYLSNPNGMSPAVRRDVLDGIGQLNQLRRDAVGDPEISTRMAQYEMAFRMQSSVPELTDLSTEPKHIREMYGPDVERPGSFARNCLLARRLAEQDVKFIQLMHSGWDQHNNLPTQFINQCRDTDQPSAALVLDLKQRGLLEDTLVIWGGEFGRTPFGQGDINNPKKHGRDHHPYCFSIWMAGGGVKSGTVWGSTDDYGYNVLTDGVHVHDLQATIMHLLGIDHTKLTYKYQGRHFRLTDVHGHVVDGILS